MATIINASTSNGLIQTADTSGTLQLQSGGTTKFTVDSTGAYGQLQLGTAQASTSGTNIDFTSIPSWVKRITIIFNGVSTNGSSSKLVQIGTSSGIVSTGYASTGSTIATTVATSNSTAGFIIFTTNAADILSGQIILTNITSNTWVQSHTIKSSTANNCIGGGDIALSGTLDRVRITTVNGTDTFDAGSINILYE